jgi:hypothetical protein
MRKSFEKNKSVLTEDYKYFITPELHAEQPNKETSQMSANQISMEQRFHHGIVLAIAFAAH